MTFLYVITVTIKYDGDHDVLTWRKYNLNINEEHIKQKGHP